METEESNKMLPKVDFDGVYGRLKSACGIHTDQEFADVLGIKRQAITAARKRGSVPSNWIVTVADKFSVSLDWLKNGVDIDWNRDTTLQIEKLKSICNIETDEQLAKFLGVYKKSIDKIRDNNDPIPDSWYLKISKVTNISYDRLSFGFGPRQRSEYERSLHDSLLEEEELVSSIDILPIDEEWIQKIVIRLEESLKKMDCSLSPNWKAFVISTSYSSFWNNNKKVDLKIVDACLKMALKGDKETVGR